MIYGTPLAATSCCWLHKIADPCMVRSSYRGQVLNFCTLYLDSNVPSQKVQCWVQYLTPSSGIELLWNPVTESKVAKSKESQTPFC
ncbi:uncharacterized protein EI90DRAFT_3085087 [Cantharellus anzutake]|uniref:uncharacterized protein n=1 Tax=Cantharellus anzutake TaxID=1750568 RepID=UPI00190747E7|nr:uncharacterized protein EI90DRAFT_3085087 [Cantharellus anzutake]KAF8317543.1 hypothetical protein EI90DRAFT_3085087 [Cantharellus anzutake]